MCAAAPVRPGCVAADQRSAPLPPCSPRAVIPGGGHARPGEETGLEVRAPRPARAHAGGRRPQWPGAGGGSELPCVCV